MKVYQWKVLKPKTDHLKDKLTASAKITVKKACRV
jgi:hypothetical protein